MLKESANQLPSNYRYNGIDLIKFICAFLICIEHIDPFNTDVLDIGILRYFNFGLQQWLGRIAVPFYFTASGFLLFRKTSFNNLDEDRVKNYCFKILRLSGTWTFLIFIGGKYQLWYLGALVLAIIILCVFIKKNFSLRSVIVVSIGLFIIGLFGDSYYGFIEPLKRWFVPRMIIDGYDALFKTTRNAVFFGLVFVLMGALFAQKKIIISNLLAVFGFVISMFIMLIEVFLVKYTSNPKDYNMFLSLLPVVFFMFYLATHIKLKNRPIYGSLNVIGTLVFFTHLFVNYFVESAVNFLNCRFRIDLSAFIFILTVILSTLLAVLIERLSRTKKLQWLKYLYS